MIIKTEFEKKKFYSLIWSYFFILVLLLTDQVFKCQFDTEDNDEIGGSLLSLASPAPTNSTDNKAANNLFMNPLQEKVDEMNALTKLTEENEQAKLLLNYTSNGNLNNNTQNGNNNTTTNLSKNKGKKSSFNNTSYFSSSNSAGRPGPNSTNQPGYNFSPIHPSYNNSSSQPIDSTSNLPSSNKNDPQPLNSDSGKKNFISRSKRTTSSYPSTNIPQTVVVNINGTNIHNPYGKETFEMRNISIIFIECYGILFLLTKMFLSCFRSNKKSFFTKLVKSLMKQSHFYFLFLIVVYILYIFGAIDKLRNNWELFLGGIGILGITWLLINMLIILLSTMIVKKWNELENYNKSFSKLKEKYEQLKAIDYQDNKSLSFIHQCFEYLSLKIFFSIPMFPIFKKMTLRKDFRFSEYLKFCLSEKLRYLFKFSWTCWIIAMFWIIFWHVVVAPLSLNWRICIMFPAPILGLIITLMVYAYMQAVYRRVVVPAEEVDPKDYNDIFVYHQNVRDHNPNFQEPLYMQEIKWGDRDNFHTIGISWLNRNIHLMIHNNYPSLYEENIFMGLTGFNVYLNLLQCILFLFSVWTTFIFSKEIFNIYYEKPVWVFACCIALFIIYFLLYSYLMSITIRWYTIISSIETRRNEKCLKKTINFQMTQYAEISQSICYAFKKILYDNLYDKDPINNPFKLSYKNFKQKLIFYVQRFKGKLEKGSNARIDDELLEFDIKKELPQFLRSCGMELDQEELDFMLHISGDKENLLRNKVNQHQLFDIWGTINHFCSLPMHDIVREVFKNYFERDDLEDLNDQNLKGFNEKKISDFLIYYKEYFADNLYEFMLEEISYLGANFTLDAFIFRIIGYGALNTY